MFRVVPVFALTLTLAACAPLSIYYKPGVAVSRMENDRLNCATDALQKAPVANQIRQRPPIYYPGRQVCNSLGQCAYTPGYWVDGGFYTVDVNQPLRKDLEQNCMAQKGYQPVSLPRCSAPISDNAPKQATTTLPRITEDTCVIPYKDGSYQIVTPGLQSTN
jgi:hypothetical protein